METHELREDTKEHIIEKIEAYAIDIRGDWTDPRFEVDEIYRLCQKLKENCN